MTSSLRRTVGRILLCILLSAVPIAGAWWMTCSAIDARFVGSWRLLDDSHYGMTFLEDGTFMRTKGGRPLGGRNKSRWSVRGRMLIIEYPASNPLENLARLLALAWSKARSTSPPLGFEQIAITDVDRRVIRGTYFGMTKSTGTAVVLEKVDTGSPG